MIKSVSAGGLIMLATPNKSGVGAKTQGVNWMGYKHDHVNLFTFERLRMVMKDRGLEEVEYGTTLFKGLPICRFKFISLFLNDLPLLLKPIWGWKSGEAIIGVWRKK